jgi:hypothetical protein
LLVIALVFSDQRHVIGETDGGPFAVARLSWVYIHSYFVRKHRLLRRQLKSKGKIYAGSAAMPLRSHTPNQSYRTHTIKHAANILSAGFRHQETGQTPWYDLQKNLAVHTIRERAVNLIRQSIQSASYRTLRSPRLELFFVIHRPNKILIK